MHLSYLYNQDFYKWAICSSPTLREMIRAFLKKAKTKAIFPTLAQSKCVGIATPKIPCQLVVTVCKKVEEPQHEKNCTKLILMAWSMVIIFIVRHKENEMKKASVALQMKYTIKILKEDI
uniref:Uncharacterized protein n=1 Tax=Micrurus lemniscatus lemniscatus TaxID=129467 RepID=A0A2D4HNX7_MICLE